VDIFRVLPGIAIAFWVPSSFTRASRHNVLAAVWTGCYGLYALVPLLGTWHGWVCWIVVLLATAAVFLGHRKHGDWARFIAGIRPRVVVEAVIGAAVVAAAIVLAFGWVGLSTVLTAAADNRTSIVLSGLLGAVFCGNDLVLLLVRNFSKIPEQTSNSSDLALIGERIGWLERAVVFSFILGGQPSAAALAITAKSLARTPQFAKDADHGFIEYFLVGTLSSLLVALAFAVATRLALGLTAL
jgi:hypothetical protein